MTRFITLTLALLIAVTSQTMAHARGGMVDPSGQVILCTGQGTITVTLDADGNITDTPKVAHICPDCTLTFGERTRRFHLINGVPVYMQTLLQAPVQPKQSKTTLILAQARAPPLNV